MKILVSAIVPVYNAENFLEKCIESLRNQTLEDIEMIFINDGSTDNSLNILRKYENLDKRIKVINQENSGPSAARNRGIEIARGEYISFIDADDWVEKDMYEEMYNEAFNNNTELVISDYWEVKDKHYYNKSIDSDLYNYDKENINTFIIKELLSNSKLNALWNKLFKKDIILNNNIKLDENLFYAEDWLFMLSFCLNINNAVYINKAFYSYVRGHESLSNSYGKNTFEITGLWIYRKRKEFAEKLNYNKYIGVSELYRVIIHCIVSELRRVNISLNEKIKNINYIIDSKECIEVIDNIDKSKFSIKEKFIYYSIKYRLIYALQLYVLGGKIKEKIYIRNGV